MRTQNIRTQNFRTKNIITENRSTLRQNNKDYQKNYLWNTKHNINIRTQNLRAVDYRTTE